MNLALVEKEKLETCSFHGAYVSKVAGHSKLTGNPWWASCPACEAEREAQRLARDAEDAKREFDERLRCANIPARFSGKTLESYETKTTSQQDALSIAKEYVENFDGHFKLGRCLIFSGRVGCGKTHLSCGILRAIIARPFADTTWRNAASHLVKYTTAAEIVREIRSTWGKRGELSEADAIRKFVRPHLLVVDEVGLSLGSDSERVQIEELIDHRYRDLKPSVICTNLAKSELPTYLGARGYDRLRENGGLVVVCDWASHRGE